MYDYSTSRVFKVYQLAIPKVYYSEGPLFRKSIVQICATVLTLG